MKDSKNFIQNKYKGDKAELDIKHILESSGYKVRKFGIEQNYQKIVDMIKFNRDSETNRRLIRSPDLVVIDPESKDAKFVEVKARSRGKTKFWFNLLNIFSWSLTILSSLEESMDKLKVLTLPIRQQKGLISSLSKIIYLL